MCIAGNVTVPDIDRINCKTPYEIVSCYMFINDTLLVDPCLCPSMLPLQIAECAHPYEENPLTADQKLCQEAEYYLHVLFQQKLQEADDTGCVSDSQCWESADTLAFGAFQASSKMAATKVVPEGQNVLEHDEPCAMCLKTADEEEDRNGSSCTVRICLVDLLRFPKIRNLCSSVEEIR